MRALAARAAVAEPPEALLSALEASVPATTGAGPARRQRGLDDAELQSKLSAAELMEIEQALASGESAYAVEFIPSPARADSGLNITTVRERIGRIGRVVRVLPQSTPRNEKAPGGLKFVLVVISPADAAELAAAAGAQPAAVTVLHRAGTGNAEPGRGRRTRRASWNGAHRRDVVRVDVRTARRNDGTRFGARRLARAPDRRSAGAGRARRRRAGAASVARRKHPSSAAHAPERVAASHGAAPGRARTAAADRARPAQPRPAKCAASDRGRANRARQGRSRTSVSRARPPRAQRVRPRYRKPCRAARRRQIRGRHDSHRRQRAVEHAPFDRSVRRRRGDRAGKGGRESRARASARRHSSARNPDGSGIFDPRCGQHHQRSRARHGHRAEDRRRTGRRARPPQSTGQGRQFSASRPADGGDDRRDSRSRPGLRGFWYQSRWSTRSSRWTPQR